MKRLIVYMAGILLLAGCSTTKHLPEGEILYTGQKKMIVELKDLLWKELNKENFHEAERIVHKNIDVSTLEFEDDDEYIFPVDEDEDDPDEEYEEYWDDDEDEDTRK